MSTTLGDDQKRRLTETFGHGAAEASGALSRWLGRPTVVAVDDVDLVDLCEAAGVLGPGDSLVAACPMELSGALEGLLILAFEDRSGLATVDLLLGQAVGTTTSWGELERSAARETANIVGCAYLNALASRLSGPADDPSASLVPGPPGFRHEFAASLLQFALMDQAGASDRLLVVRSTFSTEAASLDWSLLFVPGAASLAAILAMPFDRGEGP